MRNFIKIGASEARQVGNKPRNGVLSIGCGESWLPQRLRSVVIKKMKMNRTKNENQYLVVLLTLLFYHPAGAYPAIGGTISKKLCSKSTCHVGSTKAAS